MQGGIKTQDRSLQRDDGADVFRALVEGSSDVLVLANPDLVRLYVSPASTQVMGYRPEELLGQRASDIVHPQDQPVLFGATERLTAARPHGLATWRMRRRDGSYQWMETSLRRLPSGYIVATVRNVQRRKQAEQLLEDTLSRVETLALTDSLTGLPNRRRMIEEVEAQLATSMEDVACTMMIIDLDRFKPINDGFGHSVGDYVLQQVARRFAAVVGSQGTIGRIGGDEFAVFLPGVGEAGAACVTAGLIAAVAEPVVHSGRFLDVSASIGIAVHPQHGRDCTTLLRRADLAIHRAKQGEAGPVCTFEPCMEKRLLRAVELRGELRRAVQEGEIVPAYQPIVALADSRPIALEVLARWQHPSRGLLPPDQFIPAVDEMRLHHELLAGLLRAVCRDAPAWPASMDVHVNVPPSLLADPRLPGLVRRELRAGGFDPARLILELTEDLPMHDIDGAAAIMAELRSGGVRVVLDDFGVGHAGLQILHRLQFDGIKIDKSFSAALRDRTAVPYLGAILAFARALDLNVIVEGIETGAMRDRLRAQGFVFGQGYLFGRPTPAAGLPALLHPPPA